MCMYSVQQDPYYAYKCQKLLCFVNRDSRKLLNWNGCSKKLCIKANFENWLSIIILLYLGVYLSLQLVNGYHTQQLGY